MADIVLEVIGLEGRARIIKQKFLNLYFKYVELSVVVMHSITTLF